MTLTKHGSSNKTSRRLSMIFTNSEKKSAIENLEKNLKEDKEKSRNKCARKEREERRKRKNKMLTHHFTQAWLQNMTTKKTMMKDSLARSQNWCRTHLLLEELQEAVWVRGRRGRRLILTCVKMTKSLQDFVKSPLNPPHLWVQALEVALAQDHVLLVTLAHDHALLVTQALVQNLSAAPPAIQDVLVKSKNKERRAKIEEGRRKWSVRCANRKNSR